MSLTKAEEPRRRDSQPFGTDCDRSGAADGAPRVPEAAPRLSDEEEEAEAEDEDEDEDGDPVIPAWPCRGDPLAGRRLSNRPQDQVQHKVYSLKDYSQVAGPSVGGQAAPKTLVKSLSQDRKMGKGGKAKRMSECGMYQAAAGLGDQQPLAAESRIERMRKLFVSPLSRQQPLGHLPSHQHQHPQHPQHPIQHQHRAPKQPAGAKGFRVYGCPLQMANNIYPITCFGRPDVYKQQSVPYVLARLCNYIEENSSHLEHEGIFRVSGNARLMEKLRTLFDHLGDAPLESESVDVATSASMLKMYLRELPEPLIPTRMNYYFITLAKKYSPYLASSEGHFRRLAPATGVGPAGGAQQERQRLAFSRDLTKLVRKLPIDNYNLLKYLSCFLYRISLKQQYNKMCAEALGIVFGPNVFRIRSESYKGLKEQELSNQIMASIIGNYKRIFDSDLTDPLGNLIEELGGGGVGVEEPPAVVAVAGSVALLVGGGGGGEESHSPAPGPSSGTAPVPAPEPCCSRQLDSSREPSDEEEDDDDDDCQDESYTPSSNSGSYCSSMDSDSLESSYDDDDDDDQLARPRGSSSSDCQSDTSYTPTSSHTEASAGANEEEPAGCRACARRASQPAFARQRASNDGDDEAKSDTKDDNNNNNRQEMSLLAAPRRRHQPEESGRRSARAARPEPCRRRSSSASSLGRVRRRAAAVASGSSCKGSREHRRQQQTESQHRRASNRLRRQRAKSHTAAAAASAQLQRPQQTQRRLHSSSSASEGRSYLASAELSTLQLDRADFRCGIGQRGRRLLPAGEPFYLLRSFNSDETLLRSVSLGAERQVAATGGGGGGCQESAEAQQAARRRGDSLPRPNEEALGSFVSLIGSDGSIRTREEAEELEARRCEPILEQMRATKELCRQLKRLLTAEAHEEALMGGDNNNWLTCYADHVAASELAKAIGAKLEANSSNRLLEEEEAERRRRVLVERIEMLKQRHADLKRLREHNLRCHLAGARGRFSSTSSLSDEEEAEEEERRRRREENCRLGPLCPAKFVFQIERQLANKRYQAGRKQVPLDEMSREQLAAEKLELQKNLLRYEHWFGRPGGRLECSLVGHIYQRYRAVKLLLRLGEKK